MEIYETGTRQRIPVHERTEECALQGCVIHNPTEHTMKDFPTHWRQDRGIMERICPHGVGHPDPDGLHYIAHVRGREAMRAEATHGCDGCCAGAYDDLNMHSDPDPERYNPERDE